MHKHSRLAEVSGVHTSLFPSWGGGGKKTHPNSHWERIFLEENISLSYFFSLASSRRKAAPCGKPTFLGQVIKALSLGHFCLNDTISVHTVLSFLVVNLGCTVCFSIVLSHRDLEPGLMSLSPSPGKMGLFEKPLWKHPCLGPHGLHTYSGLDFPAKQFLQYFPHHFHLQN